jgi:ABC-type amino acid transport substrate-binding protein
MNLPGALKTGQAEAIISGMAMTPESRMEYRFTRAYLTLPARFAARKEDRRSADKRGDACAKAGWRYRRHSPRGHVEGLVPGYQAGDLLPP